MQTLLPQSQHVRSPISMTDHTLFHDPWWCRYNRTCHNQKWQVSCKQCIISRICVLRLLCCNVWGADLMDEKFMFDVSRGGGGRWYKKWTSSNIFVCTGGHQH
jgi:hypothetical protein